jgi:hypothetical protein
MEYRSDHKREKPAALAARPALSGDAGLARPEQAPGRDA